MNLYFNIYLMDLDTYRTSFLNLDTSLTCIVRGTVRLVRRSGAGDAKLSQIIIHSTTRCHI